MSGFEHDENGEIKTASHFFKNIYILDTAAGDDLVGAGLPEPPYLDPVTGLEITFEESTGLISHFTAETLDGIKIEFDLAAGTLTLTQIVHSEIYGENFTRISHYEWLPYDGTSFFQPTDIFWVINILPPINKGKMTPITVISGFWDRSDNQKKCVSRN